MAILFATTSPRLSSIVRANQHRVDEFAGHFLGRVLQDLAGLQNSHFHLRTHGVSAHGQQHLLLLKVCCLLIKDSVNAPGEQRLDGLTDGIGGVALQRSRSAEAMLAKLRSGCGRQTQNSIWLSNAAAEVHLAFIDQTPQA